MPQALLPDINTAYITYRRQIIMSLPSQKYNDCFFSLYAINALLPAEYRVTVSNFEYHKMTHKPVFFICNFCETDGEKTKILWSDIRVFQLFLSFELSIVSGKKVENVWKCPKCQKNNKVEKTQKSQETVQKPFYLQVVPEPPERKEGLLDRSSYHRKMKVWIGTFLAELEYQMGKYRAEYVPKGSEMEGSEMIDTSDDEVEV